MVLNANVGSLNTTPVGNTYRGFGASYFNNRNIAKEDFMRAEQSADNQLARDLYLSQYVNDFNASEAQKPVILMQARHKRLVNTMNICPLPLTLVRSRI